MLEKECLIKKPTIWPFAKFKKQWSFRLFNWTFVVAALAVLLTLYIVPWAMSWDPCPDDVSDNYSSFMTADGLITTSTFAFVAFASISPSASGSTLVMNRLGWKGTYVLRYPFLLIVSALLTLADSLLTLNGSITWEIIIGTTLSTAILVYIIIKYTLFNKMLNKNASRRLVGIIKRSVESNDYEGLDNIFRTYWNPLRATSNADLVKRLVTDEYMLDFLIKYVFEAQAGFNTPKIPKERIEIAKREYINSRLESKLKEIFKLNNVMSLEMKLYVLGVMRAKMVERNLTANYARFHEIVKEEFLSKRDNEELELLANPNAFMMLSLDLHSSFTETKASIRRQVKDTKKKKKD